jgi:Pyridoxamine 5'-phosphate oxidase
MSKLVGSTLPGDLYRRLAGKNLQASNEKAILVCTTDPNGWPHPAILSYFEMVAKDERNIRLAAYRESSMTSNMRRNGKLTILILDERVAYYIKGTVEELAQEMECSPHNSKLNVRVEQVLADSANEEFEPGVYITSGVTYKRPAELHQAMAMLSELLG